ncbi:hypothetical protein MBLNU457_7238t1 [Dothideomycetes sp. NU457]
MQYSTIIFAFAALAAAAPGVKQTMSPNTKTGILRTRQTAELCGSGSAYCCETDVLGVADLDCTNPTGSPATTADFEASCATVGKTAECCLLGADGITLLCSQQ